MRALTIRLARFLRRWSAPTGSTGPLIAYADEENDFGYIALRIQIGHKLVWLRLVKKTFNRFSRLWISPIIDEREDRGRPHLRRHLGGPMSLLWIILIILLVLIILGFVRY